MIAWLRRNKKQVTQRIWIAVLIAVLIWVFTRFFLLPELFDEKTINMKTQGDISPNVTTGGDVGVDFGVLESRPWGPPWEPSIEPGSEASLEDDP